MTKKATKEMGKKTFKEICEKLFKFLEVGFGFTLSEHKHDIYGDIVIYKNNTTAVKIKAIERDAGVVYVIIARLVNGDIPEEPVFVQDKPVLHSFDLEDLIALRTTTFKIKRPPIEELFKPKNQEKVLKQLANALKKYADDVLTGDFRIFASLEKIVRSRVAS